MPIYAIQAVIGGPIKLGRSERPAKRLADLQLSSPFEPRIIASYKSADDTVEEGALHRRFSLERLHGEWFIPSSSLCVFIEQLVGSVFPTSIWAAPEPRSAIFVEPATIAERIRALRAAAHLSQMELATAAGVEREEIARIERGASKANSWRMRDGLCRAFGIGHQALDAFLGGKLSLSGTVELLNTETA